MTYERAETRLQIATQLQDNTNYINSVNDEHGTTDFYLIRANKENAFITQAINLITAKYPKNDNKFNQI